MRWNVDRIGSSEQNVKIWKGTHSCLEHAVNQRVEKYVIEDD